MLKGEKFTLEAFDTTLESLLLGQVRIPKLYQYVTRPKVAAGMVDPFTKIAPSFQHPNGMMAAVRSTEALDKLGIPVC